MKSAEWLNIRSEDRGRLLYKLSDLVEQNADTLAAIEALGLIFYLFIRIDFNKSLPITS